MSFEEQVKCLRTNIQAHFQSEMEAIMFIILQTFFATRPVLKIGEYSGDIRSPDAFRPIAREENI